jgi:hypothetical protein
VQQGVPHYSYALLASDLKRYFGEMNESAASQAWKARSRFTTNKNTFAKVGSNSVALLTDKVNSVINSKPTVRIVRPTA